MVSRNFPPFDLWSRHLRAKQTVTTRCVEYVTIPGQRTQSRKIRDVGKTPLRLIGR